MAWFDDKTEVDHTLAFGNKVEEILDFTGVKEVDESRLPNVTKASFMLLSIALIPGNLLCPRKAQLDLQSCTIFSLQSSLTQKKERIQQK